MPGLGAVSLAPPQDHRGQRRTCATLLLSNNVNPKIVSEMLGYASVSVTLDIYSHHLPDMQEKAARLCRRRCPSLGDFEAIPNSL